MNEKSETLKQEIPVIIPSDAPKIYASGVFGGHSANDFRMLFFTEEPLPQDEFLTQGQLKSMREVQVQLILPPLAAKLTAQWLMQQVELFEKNVGPIPIPKQKKSQ
jgi:hypothetical protein